MSANNAHYHFHLDLAGDAPSIYEQRYSIILLELTSVIFNSVICISVKEQPDNVVLIILTGIHQWSASITILYVGISTPCQQRSCYRILPLMDSNHQRRLAQL